MSVLKNMNRLDKRLRERYPNDTETQCKVVEDMFFAVNFVYPFDDSNFKQALKLLSQKIGKQ